mgnify:CR=1 FL=1
MRAAILALLAVLLIAGRCEDLPPSAPLMLGPVQAWPETRLEFTVQAADPDGGVTMPDGAVVVEEGGVSEDAAGEDGCHGVCSFECGYEACLIENGDPGGFCGPCGSDLDCCPPLLCNQTSGLCYYPGG